MPISLKRASVFCEGLDHPECVAVHPDGSIYAGGEAGQIYHISADGKTVKTIANTGGFILGVAVSPDGRWLAACDSKNKSLWRIDLPSGKAVEISRGSDKISFRIPNHLAFLPDGTLFITDSGGFREISGRIFRFKPNGRVEVWHDGPFNFANGIAVGPGGDALYVVCTWLPGVEKIEIRADGSAGRRTIYARTPKALPDGLCFDARGNLYLSCYTPARIYRVTPRKQVSILIDDWEAHTLSNPTNIAFGGRKFDQLFVANIGRWHITRIDLKTPGLRLAHNKSS